MSDLLNALNGKIDALIPQNVNPIWDNERFIKHMNVSKRTVQAWRDEGKISFSQIGNKIYYRYADIELFLDEYRIDAFKYKRK